MYTKARAFKRTNSHGRTTSKTFFNDANVKKWGFFENLFEIIDKDRHLKKHVHKSFTASRLLKDWLEEFGGLSTDGIKLSFEKLDSLILESLQIIEDKLKLENTFNKNQSTNNN